MYVSSYIYLGDVEGKYRVCITDSKAGLVEIFLNDTCGTTIFGIICLAVIKYYSQFGCAGKQLAQVGKLFSVSSMHLDRLIDEQDDYCFNVPNWNAIKKQRDDCLAVMRLIG